jgi:hypothetical protein
MKMPQAGLVAPTLCPRCDAPAVDGEMPTDRCAACSLQLRWCGNCRGVAGPFDRFCGFCGFELIRGEPRSPLWRLWAVALIVLLAAGAGFGLWKAGVPAAVSGAVRSLSAPRPRSNVLTADHYSRPLAVHYSVPSGWTVVDYSTNVTPQPVIVLARNAADQSAAAATQGDLTGLDPVQSTVMTLGRPPGGGQVVVDARDPLAALTSEVAPLVASPPSGLKVDVAEPVHAVTIGNRPAAVVVLKLTRGDVVTYLRRVVVYAPRAGVTALFQADALTPAAQWPAVDSSAVAAVIRSLSLT